jgi:hypothetical protein
LWNSAAQDITFSNRNEHIVYELTYWLIDWLMAPGSKLENLVLLGKCSITWTILLVFFCFSKFVDRYMLFALQCDQPKLGTQVPTSLQAYLLTWDLSFSPGWSWNAIHPVFPSWVAWISALIPCTKHKDIFQKQNI